MNTALRALALAVLSSVVCAPARAIVSGDYYEETKTTQTPAGSASAVSFFQIFPTLPDLGKPYNLSLTEISCTFDSTTMFITKMTLFISNGGTSPRRPHAITVPRIEGTMSFRDPMNFLVGGGPPRAPMMRVDIKSITGASVSSFVTLTCTLVGTVIPS